MADIDDTVEYDEEQETVAPAAADATVKKGSYVSVHAIGFKDFMLHEPLMKALTDAAFEHPSEVQQQAIPQAILGLDVLCQAKSGMGKTAVFVLSTLQQLGEEETKNKDDVLCLVMTHTRELAYQIEKEYKRFSKYMPHIRPAVFYGGQPITENRALLKKDKPNVVVGTPGRVLALVRDKDLKLNNLRIFVLDECDRMLEAPDMRRDVQEILVNTPQSKQVLMFTATLPAEIRTVCKKFMHNPLEILVDNETKLTLHGLQQYYVSLSEEQKLRRLLEVLDSLEFNQVVIFVKSAARAENLAKFLQTENFPAVFIHARLSQDERILRYTNFKAFKDRIMIATDLFGRGIDIAHVNIVINFDVPESPDSYLHRVGRAGRFGTKGLAVTFVQQTAEDVEMIEKIQKRFEVEIKELPATIDKSTYMMS